MAHIYLAFVDTPGILAALIHLFLKQKYIHVVIAMDEDLEEAYSVGRRNPRIPILAGFEREDKRKILRAFPTADYMICELDCSAQQKNRIRETLHRDYLRRYQYHYAVLGLLFIVCSRPFYQKNHYTCSSYIAKLLQDNDIMISRKHFSLVTPRDFYQYQDKRIVFEGSLKQLVDGVKMPQEKGIGPGPGIRAKQGTKSGRSFGPGHGIKTGVGVKAEYGIKSGRGIRLGYDIKSECGMEASYEQ